MKVHEAPQTNHSINKTAQFIQQKLQRKLNLNTN